MNSLLPFDPANTRVLILFNKPLLPLDHPDADSEHEITYTVDEVHDELQQAGYQVGKLGVDLDARELLSGITEFKPHVIFNLFEGLADWNETEAYVAGMLEWLRIPYTGCPFMALSLGRNKHLTKQILKGAGLPTADFYTVDRLPAAKNHLGWPVIVKPATQDASVGLDQGSVVRDQEALEARAAYLLKQYGGPVLVEEFILGREFNLGVIEMPELKVLPVAEVLFEDKGEDWWPIVTYDAKWKPGTRDYEGTPALYPATVTPELGEMLSELSEKAFRVLGCRDYARVDFRVKAGDIPYILEINPNPDYSPIAGLSGAITSAGLTHPEFTVKLVEMARARGRQLPN